MKITQKMYATICIGRYNAGEREPTITSWSVDCSRDNEGFERVCVEIGEYEFDIPDELPTADDVQTERKAAQREHLRAELAKLEGE